MAVIFVVTEHATLLGPDKRPHYERIRGRLEEIAGVAVASVDYADVEDLNGAEAVVLSGSFAPWAAHDPDDLERLGEAVRGYGGPVLGICAGMQLQAIFAGGSLRRAREQPQGGFQTVRVLEDGDLLRRVGDQVTVYQHHTDEIADLPAGFQVLAESADCVVEAVSDSKRRWWGTQFHPEEFGPEYPDGRRVLENFFALALGAERAGVVN